MKVLVAAGRAAVQYREILQCPQDFQATVFSESPGQHHVRMFVRGMEKTEDRIMAGQNHKENQSPMILSCHDSVAGHFGCGCRAASLR